MISRLSFGNSNLLRTTPIDKSLLSLVKFSIQIDDLFSHVVP